MNALILAVALAAAPVLEPDPGTFKRIQPRAIDASSFLANGWNKFEQNYLPIYAVDDDPATAWVEGVAGPGIGESFIWYGPHLKKARAFRIFVRSGYQKSKALYDANARPQKIRVVPIGPSEAGSLAVGSPVEIALADALGWQKIELPVPADVSGFKLTVLSAYAGTKYEDLCISDVRVYVDGDDAYQPAAEEDVAERIRSFVADRVAAAKAGTFPAVELAPRYVETSLGTFPAPEAADDDAEESLSQEFAAKVPSELAPVLARAVAAAKSFETQREKKILEKHSVRVASTVRGLSGRATSLAAATRDDSGLARMLRYLAVKDFAAFETRGPDRTVDAVTQAQQDLVAAGTEAATKCLPICSRALNVLGSQRAFADFTTLKTQKKPGSCAEFCREGSAIEAEGPGSHSEVHGMYVVGTLATPEALYQHGAVTDEGDRDSTTTIADNLIAYEGGLARSMTSVHDDSDMGISRRSGAVYLFEWSTGSPGHLPQLRRLYKVSLEPTGVSMARFDPA